MDPDASSPPRNLLSDPDVVSVLAHDLRNYLTVVYSRLGMLERRTVRDGHAEAARLAVAATRTLDMMSIFIDTMLDASRVEHGLFALNLRPLDLTLLVRQTAELFHTDRLPVVARTPGDIVIIGDQERLRQVLHNLLANALRHSPPGAPISLSATKEERNGRARAIVAVCDQGSGIPPETLTRLFQPFSRGTRSGGLGLGLYLVRRIVEAHGGLITVRSTVGAGTYIQVALPIAPTDRVDGSVLATELHTPCTVP
jgi:two-component system, OmpR family, sensor kinase